MFGFLKKRLRDEDGAVTVDWVVLTAGIVGMALAVMTIFHDGPLNIGQKISGWVSNMSTT